MQYTLHEQQRGGSHSWSRERVVRASVSVTNYTSSYSRCAHPFRVHSSLQSYLLGLLETMSGHSNTFQRPRDHSPRSRSEISEVSELRKVAVCNK